MFGANAYSISGLDVDNIKTQPVLFYDSVQSFVTRFVYRCLMTRKSALNS
jgi:hypothetical protein